MSIDKAEKRKKLIARANGKTDEPIISEEGNYTSQLSNALNWHSRESDNKQRKAWVLSYLKQAKRTAEVDALSDISEWHFYSLGALVRLKMLDSFLTEQHEQFIENRIAEIIKTSPKARAIVKTNAHIAVITTNIQDRILEKAREVMGNIEGEFDEFYQEGCPANFKIKTPIKSYNPQILRHITSFVKPRIEELKEVQDGKDKQLVEGYSNFTKVQIRRYIALLDSLIAQCEEQKVAAKAARKPRARKAKPASVQVAKVKYQKEFAELKLKSINPTEIIGADELWVYNTKYRRLTVYRAADSNGLAVKGTSIINYTVKGSSTKTLRKPEDFIPKVFSTTKRSLGPEFRNIKTKDAQPNGRINEETILLRAFK